MYNHITVYLGSGGKAPDIYRHQTIELATLLADHHKHIIYGGMNAGLMGLLAQTALRKGAAVTGIIPRKIQDSERILGGLTRTLLVEELCDRKRLMFEEADAIVAMPGGFGTLDETLEALYWGSQGLHSKPIILVNVDGYWDPIIAFLKTLPDFESRYLLVVNKAADVLAELDVWDPLAPIQTPAHMPHFEDEITRFTDQPLVIDKATLENAYFAVCALGLKQLSKHQRAIGFLNDSGQFDLLLQWVKKAHADHFITDACITLFDTDANEETLWTKLRKQTFTTIDLHQDKWGE